MNNLEPGQIRSGSFVNVGVGNTVSNLGILSPGNSGTMQTTAISGNLTQGASGRLVLDVNPAMGRTTESTRNIRAGLQERYLQAYLGEFSSTLRRRNIAPRRSDFGGPLLRL